MFIVCSHVQLSIMKLYLLAVMKAIEESDCDVTMINRVRKGKELPGALWHIWEAADADKIRDMINKVLHS